MTSSSTPPPEFVAAVSSLLAVTPRPEITLRRSRPPQRLAPWSFAIRAEAVLPAGGRSPAPDEEPGATGRLILLHDPDGHDPWEGTFRLVLYLRTAPEADIAGDPLLPDIGWSWLVEALRDSGARWCALGGTVTQTLSARFGDIAGPARTDDVEIRASWTAASADFSAHTTAFLDLLAVAAGLPPVGVHALAPAVNRPVSYHPVPHHPVS